MSTFWVPYSNSHLYFVHSSNGKSVSWSEPGARHPPKGDHMWHRLSVHVKRQEAGSNQMAVIKPLTNTFQGSALEFSDLSTKTLYNVAEEEDEVEPVRYNPPDTPPMIAHGQIPSSGIGKESVQDVGFYTPEQQNNSTISQRVIVDHQTQDLSIFNSDILKGKDMIALPEAVSGGRPVYHQAHLIQHDPILPVQLDPFDDIPASPLEDGEELDNEHFGLLQGYMYNNAQIHQEEDFTGVKMEESLIPLMPPSPFRDCAGPPVSPFPNSPMSESILCTPPNVTYASVIFRDYKHSSSTL